MKHLLPFLPSPEPALETAELYGGPHDGQAVTVTAATLDVGLAGALYLYAPRLSRELGRSLYHWPRRR
jgi:hypothetical protein